MAACVTSAGTCLWVRSIGAVRAGGILKKIGGWSKWQMGDSLVGGWRKSLFFRGLGRRVFCLAAAEGLEEGERSFRIVQI